MDWRNERYVRVFTRDSEDWLCWAWQTRAVFLMLARKVDRAGVLETKRGPVGVSTVIGVPVDVVEPALTELLKDRTVVTHPVGYLIRNFIVAQETPQSDRARARAYRERRRDTADGSTSGSTSDRHAPSRPITPYLAVPSQTDPDTYVLPEVLPVLPEEHDRPPAQPELALARALVPPVAAKSSFDFGDAYRLYPRSDGRGKKKGLDRCRAKIRTQSSFALFQRAVAAYAEIVRVEQTEPRYVMHFSTFVNCWEDYVEAKPRSSPARARNAGLITVDQLRQELER